MRDSRSARWPAWVADGLAFASAGVSAYWTMGGTLLLDTVGGAIENLARERSRLEWSLWVRRPSCARSSSACWRLRWGVCPPVGAAEPSAVLGERPG